MNKGIAEKIAELLNKRNELDNDYNANKILKDADNYQYIPNENNNVIGAVEIKRVQWYQQEIRHLSVAKSFEGHGYGRKLIEMAEKKAKESNARIVQCTIRSDNKRSKKLFSKNGYRHVSTFHNKSTGNNVEVWQKIICPSENKYRFFRIFTYIKNLITSSIILFYY